MTPELLGVIGAFVTVGLAINAFFIKELVDSIHAVKVALAIIETKYSGLEKRLDTGENNQTDIFKRLYYVEKKEKKI